MTNAGEQSAVRSTTGIVIHRALLYDLFVWLVSLGRERAYREKTLDLASLKPGDSVLDIGCGTGTVAIAAKQRVGPTGHVCGLDASPEMLARAGKKANTAGAKVVFKNGIVEALPFPDGQFDAGTVHGHASSPRPQGSPAVCSRSAEGSETGRTSVGC